MLTIMISIISCRQQLHYLLIRLKRLKKLDLLVIRITQDIRKLLMVDSKTSIRSQNSFDLQPSLLRRGHPSLIRLLRKSINHLIQDFLPNSQQSSFKSLLLLIHQKKRDSLGLHLQLKVVQ
jgi:hypothetical protein